MKVRVGTAGYYLVEDGCAAHISNTLTRLMIDSSNFPLTTETERVLIHEAKTKYPDFDIINQTYDWNGDLYTIKLILAKRGHYKFIWHSATDVSAMAKQESVSDGK